jgi:hypothetical protein
MERACKNLANIRQIASILKQFLLPNGRKYAMLHQPMTKRSLSLIMVSLLVAQALPLVAQAAKLDLYNPRKTYGDEKIVISDADSRCVGAAFNKLYNDAQTQAKKDLAKLVDKDGNVPKTVVNAYKVYGQDIALGWAAMQEPYCGFGAFGVSAAKKSFTKTITHARADFLAKVAKKNAKDELVKASTLSLFPTSTETVAASTPATPLPDNPVTVAPAPEPQATTVVSEPAPTPKPASTSAITITRILKRFQTSNKQTQHAIRVEYLLHKERQTDAEESFD